MTYTDELHLAELLRRLPPAPEAWVQAAQELPLLRGRLDEIVALAEADAEFRRALVEDLERALAGAGFEPDRALVAALRARLADA
jgi:type VI protein secretion system component VasF